MKYIFVLDSVTNSGVFNVTIRTVEALKLSGIECDIFIDSDNKVYNTEELRKIKFVESNFSSLFKKIIKSLIGRFTIVFLKGFFVSKNKFIEYDKIFVCDLSSKFKFHKLTGNVFYILHNNKYLQLSESGFIGKFIDLYFFKRIIKRKKLIAVSNSIKSDSIRKFDLNDNQITTIYNPIELNKLNLQKKNKFIYAGRLAKQKNILFLLESYKLFLTKTKEIYSLEIYGNGPEFNVINKFVQENFSDNLVSIYNFTENIYKEIEISSASLLTSNYEGFPTVVIESLLLKTPVISTPIDPVLEIKNKYKGVVCSKYFTHEDYAESLVDFVNNIKNQNIEFNDALSNDLSYKNIAKQYIEC